VDWIRLSELSLFGHHGVHEEEQRLGQKLDFDIELGLDLAVAGHSDRLEDTINYKDVYDRVQREVTGSRHLLLEALAETIAADLLEHFKVQQVIVRARKPNVPFAGAMSHVEIEIQRGRP
jgi:dihydroneopterin aldolase